MAIRLTFADDGPSAFRFALSPLIEAMLSLHVLLEPKGHPVQHAWVRDMWRLPVDLRRTVRTLAFLYEDAIPDSLIPEEEGVRRFEDELERLLALDDEASTFALARPLFYYFEPDAGGPGRLADPSVRERIVEYAAYHGPKARQLGELVVDDPPALRARLAELLQEYWDGAFGAEWERLEPRLLEAVEEVRGRIEAGEVWDFFDELRPAIRVERAERAIVRRSGHEHEVEISAESPLLLMPSAYSWPHSRVNCDAPWPLAMIHPAPFVLRAARTEPAPQELVDVLKALADPTRLRALQLIAERPRSTEELAPLVALAEPGLSKHLRVLSAVGLVTSKRDGYYVLYSIDRERLHALGPDVLRFVDARVSEGETASEPSPRAPAT